MKRSWWRVALRVVVGVVLLLVVVVLVGVWQVRGVPWWYVPVGDGGVIDRDSRQLEDRLVVLRNEAGAIVAAEARARLAQAASTRGAGKGSSTRGGVGQVPAVGGELVLVVPPSELTAFVLKWARLNGWEEGYQQFVSDPTVSIVERRVVFAGRVKQAGGAVVSVHVRPVFTDDGAAGGVGGVGKVALLVERVTVGRMPVPVSWVMGEVVKERGRLVGEVERWGKDARLDSRGMANSAMTLELGGKLLLGVVDQVAVAGVVALPGEDGRGLPVYVTGVSVEGGVLTVRARAVPVGERRRVLGGK